MMSSWKLESKYSKRRWYHNKNLVSTQILTILFPGEGWEDCHKRHRCFDLTLVCADLGLGSNKCLPKTSLLTHQHSTPLLLKHSAQNLFTIFYKQSEISWTYINFHKPTFKKVNEKFIAFTPKIHVFNWRCKNGRLTSFTISWC